MIGKFIKPTYSLLTINKLHIPLELCNIIKKYLYYDIDSLNFIKELTKQKKEIPIIKSALSRNNMPQWTHNHIERRDENSEHWIFGFTRSRNNKFESLQLQGENCSICGEFIKRRGDLKICHC
jgi:hypothetical protein